MADDIEELKRIVEQRRLARRSGSDWLEVLVRLRRWLTRAALLVLLGLGVSVAWPHWPRIKGYFTQTAPSPASRPDPTAEPAPTPATPVRPRAEQPAPSPTASRLATGEPIPTYATGESFTLAGWRYRVLSSQWRDQWRDEAGKPLGPAAGQRFLAVTLEAQNTGAESVLLQPPRIVGADDTVYAASSRASQDAAAAQVVIGPRQRHQQEFVFEVPAGGTYRLLVADGWMSQKQAAVRLARQAPRNVPPR